MKKEKIFMIISISIFILCLMGSTYALYKRTLSSSDFGINTNTPGLDKYIIYEKGEDINGTLNTSATYIGGKNSSIKFYKKDNTYDIYGEIVLTINSIGTNLSNSSALKYVLVNNGNILSEGSLNGVSAGSKITIINNLFLKDTEQIYTIYVWLDINEELGNISGETLDISVDCSASMIERTLATYITELYDNADKVIISDGVVNYHYAESVSLLNDRLGGTSTEIYEAGNIVGTTFEIVDDEINEMLNYPTSLSECLANVDEIVTNVCMEYVEDGTYSSLEECESAPDLVEEANLIKEYCFESADGGSMDYKGNIRYSGESPDNYVYFNCSDYSKQNSSTCELWRIIGIFDGKIKIVRNDSIGALALDYNGTLSNIDNDWEKTTLEILLNDNYYYGDTSGTVTYYSDGTSTKLDMTSIGIKNDITRDMISKEDWVTYFDINSLSSSFSSYYSAEINSTTTWNGKIALPGFNDFIFSSSTLNVSSLVSWMDDGMLLYIVEGNVSDYAAIFTINKEIVYKTYPYTVRPALYLKAGIEMSGGNGTSANPYRLSV